MLTVIDMSNVVLDQNDDSDWEDARAAFVAAKREYKKVPREYQLFLEDLFDSYLYPHYLAHPHEIHLRATENRKRELIACIKKIEYLDDDENDRKYLAAYKIMQEMKFSASQILVDELE